MRWVLGRPICPIWVRLGVLLTVAITPAQASSVFPWFGDVRIYGEIKPGDFDELKKRLDARPRAKVFIKSPGGNSTEAIRMAELIHERGVAVEVTDYCASACSSFVFLASPLRTVGASGFLAFHAGHVGVLRAVLSQLQQHRGSSPEEDEIYRANMSKLQADFDNHEQRQRTAHETFGVVPLLQGALLRLTAPKRVDVRVDEANRKVTLDLQEGASCDWWVPDAAGLAEVGVQVKMADERLDRDAIARRLSVPKERIYFGRLSELGQSELTKGTCAAGVAPAGASPTEAVQAGER